MLFRSPRRAVLPGVFERLAAMGIRSIGRYGAWTYSYMEAVILDGMKAAAQLSGVAVQ